MRAQTSSVHAAPSRRALGAYYVCASNLRRRQALLSAAWIAARLLLVYGCAKAIVYMGWDFKGAIASAPTCVCACALPPRQLRRVVPPTKQCSVVCFALVFVGTIGGSFARRIRLPSARLTHVVLPMPHDARRLAAQLPIAGCMCSDAWPSVSWERKRHAVSRRAAPDISAKPFRTNRASRCATRCTDNPGCNAVLLQAGWAWLSSALSGQKTCHRICAPTAQFIIVGESQNRYSVDYRATQPLPIAYVHVQSARGIAPTVASCFTLKAFVWQIARWGGRTRGEARTRGKRDYKDKARLHWLGTPPFTYWS